MSARAQTTSPSFRIASENSRSASIAEPAVACEEFSFTVVGSENAPAYKAGNRVWVNPDEEIELGEDCLFLQEPTCADGTLAVLGELVRVTDRAWIVKQHANPEEEQSLPRKDWPTAWLVTARERARKPLSGKNGGAV